MPPGFTLASLFIDSSLGCVDFSRSCQAGVTPRCQEGMPQQVQ